MTGIEALEKIGNIALEKRQNEYGEICFRVKHLYAKSYNTIEKELKALEIIKEKNVQMSNLKHYIATKRKAQEYYNCIYEYYENMQLTQEDFELLIEVFENDE